MKTSSLHLIACMLVLSLAAAASAQTDFDLPKKPDKEPQTAKEFYEYARWSELYERDTPEKARRAVDKAIELQPNLTEALYLRGYMKLDAGDYKGALEDFNSVIQFEPNVTNTYMLRAEMRLRINPKDIDGALADYDLLINQLAARRLVVYAAFDGRSKLRYQKGDLSGALEDINQAILDKRIAAARRQRKESQDSKAAP